MSMEAYVSDVVEMISRTPGEVIFHRVTGTASSDILLAPGWCSKKWQVLNRITTELAKRVKPKYASNFQLAASELVIASA